MSGFLASVCDVTEALTVRDVGVDIIDCKNPHQGALGALSAETITRIVDTVGGECRTSATTGDDVHTPAQLIRAISVTADCGVDYVKFGLFDADSASNLIRALGPLSVDHDLIAVCFADRYDPTPLLPQLAASGIKGLMLDTADKSRGPLTRQWNAQRIGDFIDRVRSQGLVCGLAGRLSVDDIPALLPLQADYLGFRSALCRGDRRSGIDRNAVIQVGEMMRCHIRSSTSADTAIPVL